MGAVDEKRLLTFTEKLAIFVVSMDPVSTSDSFLLCNTPPAFAVTILSVDAPLPKVEAVIAPVTPRVPPTVVLPVKVDTPVTPKVPPILVLPVKVLLPAIVCEPAVMTPRAVAEASGILKVWVEPDDTILKSVPEVPGAKVCVVAVRPLRDEIADVDAAKVDAGSFFTTPPVIVSTLSVEVLVPN